MVAAHAGIVHGPDARPAPGLRYADQSRPGYRRRRHGRGFAYRDEHGSPIRDRATLDRIASLAIPPAWTDVWICADPAGHLQATGRDARQRKQYRYHPAFRARRDAGKFDRVLAFGLTLPRLRARCDQDLATPGLARDKVLAAVVRLLELTLIRVGNDEYAKLNRSFGLTTLRGRHASVDGTRLRFRFRGKSGRAHDVSLRDRRLAAVVRRCQELPGQDLFQYVDDDGVHDVTAADVNDYIRDACAGPYTAKDIRTWAGTVLAYRALRTLDPDDAADRRRVAADAIRTTADGLGNTPAVARASYVHPAVLEAYFDGDVGRKLLGVAEESPEPPRWPDPVEEAAVIRLLRRRAAHTDRPRGSRRAASDSSGRKGARRTKSDPA
jgi:DNA topoisomerase-1